LQTEKYTLSKEVYITRLARFLPGSPIPNSEMEEYLGMVAGKPSRSKSIILRNNGITERYYAIDKDGNSQYSNAEMTAKAIEKLFDKDFTVDDLELLSCGTTSPDQLLPAHASMVHGLIGGNNMETVGCSGSCLAGFQAFKTAFLNLKAGLKENAIATGSEYFSKAFRAENFEEEYKKVEELEESPYIAFERDFLRWMLSDGACAAKLETKPNTDALSLRIDWLEAHSYANELKTCMYIGAERNENGDLKGFRQFSPSQWPEQSMFSINQNTKILGENIIKYGGIYSKKVMDKYHIKGEEIDWFLPHISSMFFLEKTYSELESQGLNIPRERYFTNLTKVGNLGSAAFLFILEELFNSGKLKKGQRILAMVPESARFAYGYAHFTVV
jgi:3-oxoacyl-[acyl-carrier-protein] synthase-3